MSSNKLREFYINYHKEKNKYGRKTGGEARVKIIKEMVGTGKKILDLGCRDGSFTKFLIDGNEVIGADIDDIALSICSKNLGIKTYHIDLNDDFPFEDTTFDVVFAGEIIEHLVIPENFVKECSRVLKNGGIFCGTTPNAYRLKTRVRFLAGKPLCGDPSHLHFFSFNTLQTLLQKYFGKVEIIPFHGHIIGSYKLGIPVTPNTPLVFGKLFSRHFLWKAVKE